MATETREHETLVEGHRIAYREAGRGDPAILIHGIPTSSLLWRNVIPALARERRVIAPDMLNYGRSDKPSAADVSIAAQSRIMLGLMDALGVPRADLVAHDIGGGVAQIAAITHPERVDRLVLANAVCFDSWPIPEFEPMQRAGAEQETSLEEFLGTLRDFLPKGVHHRDRVSDDVYDMILEPWASEDGKRALFRNIRRLNPEYTEAIADELQHVRSETLVLWGRHDPFQKPEYADRLAGAIPKTRVTWIDAGHWIMEERPDEVSEAVGAFLG